MNIIRQDGFDFVFDPDACSGCGGNCCRGSTGHVWIGEHDVRSIAEYLGVNDVDFIRQYTDRIDNRLSLKERYAAGSFSCVFFDDNRKVCTIYAVRPDQCRRFPFWDHYRRHRQELFRECPGVRECPRK